MNMKKLIATALAVVMIFGLVSVGFAATSEFPDIEGYEFEAEVRRLASLGVLLVIQTERLDPKRQLPEPSSQR